MLPCGRLSGRGVDVVTQTGDLKQCLFLDRASQRQQADGEVSAERERLTTRLPDRSRTLPETRATPARRPAPTNGPQRRTQGSNPRPSDCAHFGHRYVAL